MWLLKSVILKVTSTLKNKKMIQRWSLRLLVYFIISISFWNVHLDLYIQHNIALFLVGLIAFKNLRLRIGGSLQDQVIYDLGSPRYPCHPFQQAGDV